MKKNIITLVLAFLVLAFSASCSKYYGEPETKHYSIDGAYTKLIVSHAFDVTVSDDVTDAVVTVPEKLHSKVKVKVNDGVLEIGYTSSITVGTGKATVKLPRNTELKDVTLSGASSFRGDLQGSSSKVNVSGASDYYGNINAQYVKLNVSGSSDVRVNYVTTDEVKAEISGSSEVDIEGTCTGTMDIHVSGSSDLRARNLATDAVTGELSGASNAKVAVCNLIKVSVSGSSDLIYYKSSSECRPEYKCTTSGSSSVTAM